MDSATFTAVFGRVLRQQRLQAKLTQEQLALAADLQRNYVSELERARKQASVVTLFKLAAALRVPPHEFVRLVSRELGEVQPWAAATNLTIASEILSPLPLARLRAKSSRR